MGLGSIAIKDENISEHTRNYLEKIGQSTRHLLGLINDILDISRIANERLTIRNEKFSFSDILEQINKIVSNQCQENAVNFTPAKGIVSFLVERVAEFEGQTTLKFRHRNGMDKSYLPKIFEPF